ncbi:MAG: 3-phosphoshikimate 1-carboxyvinyltransferase [Paracoccaceae bacterium]|nr:3-phosphoshikimate 1-carboxyvinyltransferase [Marinovum sp.]PDH58086.1 MAG: 3-phosphoshikimate 1-carboxyvinyltransferase [Rhodobacteraceae bacterium MED-G07]|tara:strand:- start:1228 stop:2580 length:1353 start_codon:yes stop_codon:yes gene_type:complete
MSLNPKPTVMRALSSSSLKGVVSIPGDKSISHRSLILGALAIGQTRITGLLEGQDVLDTAKAMVAFGAVVEKNDQSEWLVDGVGVGGFAEPSTVVDCGNSGTGVRLIIGAMSTTPINATFTGDHSLNSRPMERVTNPLSKFGVTTFGRSKGRLPMTVIGARSPIPVKYDVPVPSAQVKSALLLAALNAPGETIITEKEITRDHTERMLSSFGADISVENISNRRSIKLCGHSELNGQNICVPSDPSSAAFPICAAIIVEGSDIFVPNITLNETRAGLYKTLIEMGANLSFENEREESGEPVADIRACFSPDLKGVEVPPERAASMIDEYPILSVVAANATGKTIMRGVKELRVKESDRIDVMAKGLRANGVFVDEGEDWWAVKGNGMGSVKGGSICQTFLDHRIAMSFLVLGLSSQNYVEIDDCLPIKTSFPNFIELMLEIGANMEVRDL